MSEWERRVIEELRRSNSTDLVSVVVLTDKRESSARSEAAWYTNIVRNRSKILNPAGNDAASPDGSEHFRRCLDTLTFLDSLGLDAVVALGLERESKRHLASTAKYGVWSYSFDQPYLLRDQYERQEPWVSCELIAIGAGVEHDLTLHAGYLGKRTTLPQTITHVLETTAYWPSRAAAEIIRQELPKHTASAATAARGEVNGPGMWRLMRRQASRQLRYATDKAFLLDIWNVGFISETAGIPSNADPPAVDWLKPLRSHTFIADPFPAQTSDRRLLVEHFSYRQGCRGQISAVDLPDDGSTPRIAGAINAPVHMSYPHTIRVGDKVYCTPETFEEARVNIYQSRSDGSWKYKTSILDGLRVVDPTIIQIDALWWLFCTIENDHDDTKLFGFYAEEPFGKWLPHPLNPLKCDVRSARPAGAIIKTGGKVLRPTQDAAEHYGSAVNICEIVELSPSRFREKIIGRIEPDRTGPYPDGLHTLNRFDGGYVVDGLKRQFHPLAAILKAKAKSAANARRLPGAVRDARSATI